LDIIAENISDEAKYRKQIKSMCFREALIVTKGTKEEKYVYVEEFSFRLTIDRVLRYIDLSGRYIPHNVKTVRIEEFTKLGNWKSSEMSYDAA